MEFYSFISIPNPSCIYQPICVFICSLYLCVYFKAYLQILKILSKYFYLSTMQPIANLSVDYQNFAPIYIPLYDQSYKQIGVDPYMFFIMNYQNSLNLELLKNQNLISNYLSLKKQQDKTNSSKSGYSTSEGVENSSIIRTQFLPIYQIKAGKHPDLCLNAQQNDNSGFSGKIKRKKSKQAQQESEYEPEVSDTQNFKISKSSQSKNVPKNFSKAILLFIKRRQNLVKKIVEREGANYKQFIQMTESLKGRINSISELRSLWIEQQNKFAKILRIVSNIYIKRSSLQHIFNSRIEDYSKHLKYRNKICQVLKNPKQFTRMKDY